MCFNDTKYFNKQEKRRRQETRSMSIIFDATVRAANMSLDTFPNMVPLFLV